MQSLPPALLRPAATAPVPAVPAAAPPIIQMEGVSRHFGDLVAVRDVSLSVPQGSILGMIGPSGSGKTTIVRMLTGTLGPSAGSLSILEQVPLTVEPTDENRAYLSAKRTRLGHTLDPVGEE